MMPTSLMDVASLLDHSLLSPTLSRAELEEGCRVARAYSVASVCILPYFLPRCVELLSGSHVRASTTVGFPHGVVSTFIKLREAKEALASGATELDAVANLSWVKSDGWDAIAAEVGSLVEVCRAYDAKLKLIFETAALTREEKLRLCEICSTAGVDWAKTSTGFGPGGATPEDVQLLRTACAPHVQVKASGGIRTLDAVLEYAALGATRIGTSSSAAILDTWNARHARGEAAL